MMNITDLEFYTVNKENEMKHDFTLVPSKLSFSNDSFSPNKISFTICTKNLMYLNKFILLQLDLYMKDDVTLYLNVVDDNLESSFVYNVIDIAYDFSSEENSLDGVLCVKVETSLMYTANSYE